MTDTEMFSDFDDDTETGLADEYMAESKEARAKGNHELADELYGKATALHRVASGLDADPYGVEPAEPGAEGDDDAAEADAIRARQTLADESAEAQAALARRETVVAERERLATECEQSQEARDKELARREDHLRKAGVRGF